MGFIERGDIVLANLEPVRGSEQVHEMLSRSQTKKIRVGLGVEQGGIRPVLIIQNNISNKFSPTTIIAPITSKKQIKTHITNVPILAAESKLKRDSLILCNQIRTIDKKRIIKKMSNLNPYLMFQVDLAIKISLAID